MKNYSNTLLGYYKAAIARQGGSTKYLDRAFLATFLTEYRDSVENNRASYTETQKTKFYKENGASYCLFLEIHNDYENGMKRLRGIA
jgi:hypothetical protein